jgi:diguanylate cyclase (GGDEF)-like protein
MLVAMLALAGAAAAAPVGVAGADALPLLHQADDMKTSDHAGFVQILHALDAERPRLSGPERVYLNYLDAYQLAYSGDYEAAARALRDIVAETDDVTLRFRAGVTLTNTLALSAHYEEAYERLQDVLALQPEVPQQGDRQLGYGIAAMLYERAGQYDQAVASAQRWINEDAGGAGACKGTYFKLEALYRSGGLRQHAADLQSGIETCARVGEPVFANLIRVLAARVAVDEQHYGEAMKLLLGDYAGVQQSQFSRLTAQVDAVLARAYLGSGDLAGAERYARSAVDKNAAEPGRPLVEAWRVLYEVAKRRGNFVGALAAHVKFTEAEKAFLEDTSAHALAYQVVNQQVAIRKREVDALHEKNQLLLLQGQVAQKSEETQRLYILLLLLVIAFILLWSYRIKRSQMRFQKLARRDGLTGIVNRQHFMDQAKATLVSCARQSREACLILVDLDDFKNVNDTHGHVAGDGVLKQTVEMCQLHMRAADLFGRLGGEEFGVLLPDCALDTARERAEELRRAIAAFAQAGVEVTVSASFGVASTRGSGYDLRQMLIHADSALYSAKRRGRNRVEAFIGNALPA